MPTIMMLALAIGALAISVSSAHAALILTGSDGSASATNDFFGTSLPSQFSQQTFGPFGGVAIAEVGQTRAVQTGSGFNAVSTGARLGDIPGFAFRAQTDIDQEVTNTDTTRTNLVFDYLINGGELRLFDPSGSFNGLEATVGVSIFALGETADVGGLLWAWGVTLHSVGGVLTASVSTRSPAGILRSARSSPRRRGRRWRLRRRALPHLGGGGLRDGQEDRRAGGEERAPGDSLTMN